LNKKFGIVNEHDVNDFKQECLIYLMRVMHKYNPDKSTIKTFISAVCKKKILQILRNNKKVRGDSSIANFDETDFYKEEKEDIFNNIKDFLTEEEYELVELYYIQGKTQNEIAEKYDINKRTVLRKLIKIINKLKNNEYFK
jgi:RNA polymerase sigma factor (sigma-70 family)